MRVEDEAQLSAALAEARAPLRIKGGGTRALTRDAVTLDVSGLSGISLYEPGALTMVAQAGTSIAEIEAALAAEGQCLAFEPYFLRKGPSTIGGVMATNASGPRRIQAGAARDFLLGVRFVDGSGQIIQNGGRVMKNVTGYDLVKLMAGSRGTLGVLAEVSFKVLPRPETEGTLLFHALDVATAVEAMSQALGSPYDVSAAAHGLVGPKAVTALRVEGMDTSVSYRLGELARILEAHGPTEVVQGEASATLWQSIRDAEALRDKPCLIKMSVKPSAAPSFYSDLSEAFGAANVEVLLDWGGGSLWIGASQAALDEFGAVEALEGLGSGANGTRLLLEFAQAFCAKGGGHATLMRGPEAALPHVSVTQPEGPGLAALSHGLRARFDPKGLFA